MDSRSGRHLVARGFSLVELLVVMFIIGLVVAITIPALGWARAVARKASTQTVISDLGQACSRFQTDNRRVPGYFSPREMGSAENAATQGFSGIDNVMLDLAGGIMPNGVGAASGILVGPTSANKARVDVDRIGVASGTNKNYWVPDPKFYQIQNATSKFGDPAHLGLKSVVDAFGQPLLFWTTDEASLAPITPTTTAAFANESVGANGQATSKFYWASNAAFLKANALGRLGRDQSGLSMLREASGNTSALRTQYMTAFLGNPAAIANPADPQSSWVPSSGRGKFIIQSAGKDGTFLSTEDSGYKKNGGTSLTFSQNFPAGSSKASDILSDFDDLVQSGGF
jgi:hypothetical protein